MRGNRTGTLRVAGANLYYEVRGSGPVLLVLQGGDGDAGGAAALVAALAEHYTVVTYDRRGLSRSRIDAGADRPTIETHGDDAHRLLSAVTTEPALVFGGSLGALVGLDLAVRHPEQVRALVAHEPPAAWLLPDPERAGAERAQAGIEAVYRRDGVAAAMRAFVAVAGLRFDDLEPGVELPRPSGRRQANLEFFLANDAGAARAYRPDRAAVRAARTRIVPAAGATSRGTWVHRCAEALAELVGAPVAEFPGGHNGFITHPRAFGARLREAFGGVPAERRR